MTLKTPVFLLTFFICLISSANDTLYFRLLTPSNPEKSPTGEYLRKCVKEGNHFHTWDYNNHNILVMEGYYSDTLFLRKLLCHKFYDERNGILSQTRCYENGRPHGYFVYFDLKGDTSAFQVFDKGEFVKGWNSYQGDTELFQKVEQAAEFHAGPGEWDSFLYLNITYSEKIQKDNIGGSALARITIDSTGVVSKVEILESTTPVLNEELIKIIKTSPRWKPAIQNGRNVSSAFLQPINF
jgi:hypothetical protein